jgi:hypothetical protein
MAFCSEPVLPVILASVGVGGEWSGDETCKASEPLVLFSLALTAFSAAIAAVFAFLCSVTRFLLTSGCKLSASVNFCCCFVGRSKSQFHH